MIDGTMHPTQHATARNARFVGIFSRSPRGRPKSQRLMGVYLPWATMWYLEYRSQNLISHYLAYRCCTRLSPTHHVLHEKEVIFSISGSGRALSHTSPAIESARAEPWHPEGFRVTDGSSLNESRVKRSRQPGKS
ncbi:hypothetical protein IAQ61_007047 [Plenodomus lingam]|uniref:uncharacterized protein n=1 Tax=Leptosphaeria maculans TaxID=5022 RepID=UPI003329A781|nr:hypothetical protein IAQ61_007047 [Plenodomus lingam]